MNWLQSVYCRKCSAVMFYYKTMLRVTMLRRQALLKVTPVSPKLLFTNISYSMCQPCFLTEIPWNKAASNRCSFLPHIFTTFTTYALLCRHFVFISKNLSRRNIYHCWCCLLLRLMSHLSFTRSAIKLKQIHDQVCAPPDKWTYSWN